MPLLVQHSGHFFCSAAESNWGFFGFVSVPAWVLEFYDHKSFTSQMDDSNKSRHTHAHTHMDTGAHNLDVAWRGHFITRTHIAHTQRWPQASFASFALASLAALIKLVLGCYYGCIAWHRLMCVTRRSQPPFSLATFPPVRQLFLCHCRIVFCCLRGRPSSSLGHIKKVCGERVKHLCVRI